ncbi:MAG TPA: hypothetical protein VG797_10835 [Phycisphaerales bacterium]|nr:hypothetical protein [Phycisphaerales bacterium]
MNTTTPLRVVASCLPLPLLLSSAALARVEMKPAPGSANLALAAPDLARGAAAAPFSSNTDMDEMSDDSERMLACSASLTLEPIAAQPAESSNAATVEPGAPVQAGRARSWELPPVVVEGEPASSLREEDRIGPYGQPRWTATRRFPSTRVDVIPEGKVEVEGWARATVKRSDQGGETDWRFLQEVEFGLPYRFQVDLYLRQDYDTGPDETLWGGQFEVRWALADWGKLPGNPTLYFEYITLEDRPDKIEPKVLLGGEIAEGWHWGTNFIFEYELSGGRECEYSVSAALSRTIIDEVLSLGVETVFAATDVKGARGDFETSFVIGPSLQWRPVQNATVNIAPLIGIGNESPIAQIYFNIGWEF